VSIRKGVKGMMDRWDRARRTLPPGDRAYVEQLVASAKKHSSEAFYGCDDPLEAAIFSALVEIARYRAEFSRDGEGPAPDVDP